MHWVKVNNSPNKTNSKQRGQDLLAHIAGTLQGMKLLHVLAPQGKSPEDAEPYGDGRDKEWVLTPQTSPQPCSPQVWQLCEDVFTSRSPWIRLHKEQHPCTSSPGWVKRTAARTFTGLPLHRGPGSRIKVRQPLKRTFYKSIKDYMYCQEESN